MARKTFTGFLALLSFVVVGVGIAWACTPSAEIVISPAQGRANDSAAVSGAQFQPGEPVQLHWDSPSGPMIGTATGPSFSVAVTIPASAPGTHNVVAIQSSSSGGVDSTTFEVLPAPAPEPEPEPGGSPGPGGGQGTGNAPTPDGSPGPGGGNGTGNAPAPAGEPSPPSNGAGDPAAAGAPNPSASPPSSAPAPAEAAQGLPEPARADAFGPGSRADAPSRASALQNLWEGFTADEASSSASGLAPGSGMQADDGGSPGFLLPLGTAVLGFGLVALLMAGVAGRRGDAVRIRDDHSPQS